MYQLKRSQIVKATKAEVWSFICNPKNLREITPDHMQFKVLTEDLPNEMYEGMMVHYQVRPMFNIPILWVTEITKVQAGEYFVDEQRVGPYRLWHHEHFLKDHVDGVEMIDIVSYLPPFGILGRIMNALFIIRQLDAIFKYREKVVNKLFKTNY